MTIRSLTTRAVAVVAAYAVALQALLGAFGLAVHPAGAGFDPLAVLCVSDRGDPGSGAPVSQDPACPCGAACTMSSCGGSSCGGPDRTGIADLPAPGLVTAASPAPPAAAVGSRRTTAGIRPLPRAPPQA